MMITKDFSNWDNLSLARLKTRPGYMTKGGQEWRTTCPFHQGHNPTAFSVSLTTGLFFCFVCRARGILLDFCYGDKPVISLPQVKRGSLATLQRTPKRKALTSPAAQNQKLLKYYEQNLTSGESYLHSRGISLTTARHLKLGYSPAWRFVSYQKHRQATFSSVYHPAIIFPLTGPEGVINFYARGITNDNQRLHHIKSGKKGIFNFEALLRASIEEPVILVEGCFDALAMMEAGYPNAAALVGVSLGNLAWYKSTPHIILAFDHDDAGQVAQLKAAARLKELGFAPKVLPASLWHSHKDFSSYWQQYGSSVKLDWEQILARCQLA